MVRAQILLIFVLCQLYSTDSRILVVLIEKYRDNEEGKIIGLLLKLW